MAEAGQDPIGGYFALEPATGDGLRWAETAVDYQSARCAIAAILQAAKPKAVWVPHYICGAVNDAVAASGVRARHYALAEDFGVPESVEPDPSDWLLCVDYFGTCGPAVDRASRKFGAERILVDASQALFHGRRPGSAVVYSPRKFVGVPDGGLLLSSLDIPPPRKAQEADSLARSRHLRTRLSGGVEAGYAEFLQAEESLRSCEPVAMSGLTQGLLGSIDFARVADRRVSNYRRMAGELARHGLAVRPLHEGAVPLCCPLHDVEAVKLRQDLAARRIFTPTYWPDAALPENDRVAVLLRDRTLFLPCDQRYGEAEVMRVVRTVLELMGKR